MEKIFDQTLNYAAILPLKNYSRLDDKDLISNITLKKSRDCEDFFESLHEYGHGDLDSYASVTPSYFDKKRSFFLNFVSLGNEHTSSSRKRKNRKVKHFYNDKDEDERVILLPASNKKNVFYTTDDRQIKKYFSDPFVKMEISTYKRVIYKDENKLIIKTIFKQKYRSINWRFFKESINSDVVSFNLKTGNFTIIDELHKVSPGHPKTRFRTNHFQKLNHLIKSKGMFNYGDRATSFVDPFITTEFKRIFNDAEFYNVLNKSLLANPVESLDKNNIFDLLINDFISKRKIKVPNDYKELVMRYFPRARILKKNNNKLIQGILDTFGIKSKQNVKLLHEHPYINIVTLIHTCHLFGEDFYNYVSKIPFTFFENTQYHDKYSILEEYAHGIPLSKEEKDNMLNVIMDSSKIKPINPYLYGGSSNFESLIKDHLLMLEKVRIFFPDTKFMARNKPDFNKEHSELTKIISRIKKGWTTEYQFDEEMLKDVENEMVALKDKDSLIKLKPFVLKREDDYIDEGEFMHHCVASYVGADKSVIISLRTLDGEDRVTCEFNIQSGKVIQKRHFCNRNPPEHFIDGLDQLEEKVLKYARWGRLNWKEKKRVPVKINGVDVIIDDLKPKTFHDVLMDDPWI